MAKPAIGARVMYCGHDGFFVADIFLVGNVNVVRANGPVTSGNIIRTDLDSATHHLRDFPLAGFWSPQKGIFVVPAAQVKVTRKRQTRLKAEGKPRR